MVNIQQVVQLWRSARLPTTKPLHLVRRLRILASLSKPRLHLVILPFNSWRDQGFTLSCSCFQDLTAVFLFVWEGRFFLSSFLLDFSLLLDSFSAAQRQKSTDLYNRSIYGFSQKVRRDKRKRLIINPNWIFIGKREGGLVDGLSKLGHGWKNGREENEEKMQALMLNFCGILADSGW